MPAKFELRIDRIRLRGDGRNTPALQEKYIARAGGGAYMAVATTEDGALKEVLRTMRMHYRRIGVAMGDVMTARILRAIETPCERVPGAANDIRAFPLDLLKI
ncbi:MAG: hypothetical protein H6865_08375 [Rhodospirillales bacterium]|nr:hypothetical protein [Alphaproteobacteria bacterium]MCB9987630.1 hypothetical protein [Rhodospirillales bacterium]USO08071.1 MAG: hypothetical protein H6866_02300 [Rhodospirillales bacterium]